MLRKFDKHDERDFKVLRERERIARKYAKKNDYENASIFLDLLEGYIKDMKCSYKIRAKLNREIF